MRCWRTMPRDEASEMDMQTQLRDLGRFLSTYPGGFWLTMTAVISQIAPPSSNPSPRPRKLPNTRPTTGPATAQTNPSAAYCWYSDLSAWQRGQFWPQKGTFSPQRGHRIATPPRNSRRYRWAISYYGA